MSQPATYDFKGQTRLRIGVDWRWSLAFKAAGVEPVTPIDITGNSFVLQARKRADEADVEFTLSTDGGELQVQDGPGGVLACVMKSAATYSVAPGTYVYGLVRVVDGQHLAVLEGTLEATMFANR